MNLLITFAWIFAMAVFAGAVVGPAVGWVLRRLDDRADRKIREVLGLDDRYDIFEES